MANRRNNNRGGDIYGEMYDEQLKRYQQMSGDTGRTDSVDIRFYTEDEMAALERANQQRSRPQNARRDNGYGGDGYRGQYDQYGQGQYGQYGQRGQYEQASRYDRGGQYSRGSQGGQYDQYNQYDQYDQYGGGDQYGYDQYGGQGQYGYDEQPQERPAYHQGSYDDRRRRVKSSAGRYHEATERKRGNKQLAFGRYDPEGEAIRKKSRFSFGKFMRALLILVFIAVLLVQVLVFRYISMVDSVSTGRRTVSAAEMSDSKVTNILLIGSDSRKDDDAGRTDSMIILSMNSRSKEITLTSVMRDSYVEIPEHGWGKLNSAYTFGGAELLLDTIQLNFGVKIDRYVFVSFFSFINIVDAVGGINLDISDEEAQGMTDPMAEQNKYLKNKKGTDYLKKGGKNIHVNGNQALAYARLRYVGNADFERTDRQRLVINKIVEKAKTLNPIELDNFFKLSCRELTTNMSAGEMYILFYKLLFSLGYDRSELRVPPEGAYSYGNHEGLSTLDLDFDSCKRVIKEKVYK